MKHDGDDPTGADDALVHAVLMRMVEDRAHGRILDSSEYKRLFPQAAALIDREFEAADASDVAHHGHEEHVGPWIIERELGRGGQGAVFLVRDTRLPRRAALKRLRHGGRFAGDTAATRLRREAEALARLDHQGLAAVIETGGDDGDFWIAMRFVEGRTWAEVLREGAAVDAISVAEASARALHAAHEAGIVHRDVKPGNIIITPSGDPVVVDFGLAADAASDIAATMSGDILGTPAYLAPEQIDQRRGVVDRRTDVYALGVALYEACVGRRPFTAPTAEALYRVVLDEEPTAPRRIRAELSRDLETVILTAMAKEPVRRYATALDFAADLHRLRDGMPVAARPVSRFGRAARFARRRPAVASLILVLALGVPSIAGLSGYILATEDDVRARREELVRFEQEKLLGRAFLEVGEGDPKAALRLFSELCDVADPSAEAVAGLMMSYLKLDKPAEALATAALRSATVVGRPSLRLLIADAHRALKDHAAAKREEEAAGPPVDAFGHFLRSQRLLQSAHATDDPAVYRAAADAATLAALSVEVPRALFDWERLHAEGHLAALEAAAGRTDGLRVKSAAELVNRRWPGLAPTHFWTMVGLLDVDLPGAERAARARLELKPEEPRTLSNLARLRANQGDLAEALTLFERAIRAHPWRTGYAHDLAHDHAYCLSLAGRTDDYLAELRRASGLPGAPDMYSVELADALVDAGRTSAALEFLGERPRSAAIAAATARALRAAGRSDEAAGALEAAASRSDVDGPFFAELAEARFRDEDPEGAAQAWRQAAERAGRDDTLRIHAASRIAAAGDPETAAKILNSVSASSEHRAVAEAALVRLVAGATSRADSRPSDRPATRRNAPR